MIMIQKNTVMMGVERRRLGCRGGGIAAMIGARCGCCTFIIIIYFIEGIIVQAIT